MEFRNYRVKSSIKSFRDLEVYQKTIQLSDEITNLPFLNKEEFKKDNEEIKFIAEKIPKLIAESYGDKFDSKELAHKKLTEAVTLITNAITKIDLLRQRFMDDKKPAPAPQSLSPLPTLSDNNTLSQNSSGNLSPAVIAEAGAVSPDVDSKSAVINETSGLGNNSATSALLSNNPFPKLPVSEPLSPDSSDNKSLAGIVKADVSSAEIRREAKEILDNLLARYQTQKVKVLNLRKAWDRVFTNEPQQAAGFNYKK